MHDTIQDTIWPVDRPIATDAIKSAEECAAQAHLEETARNRDLMLDFVHILYEQREARTAFEKYVHEGYIQHNPKIADGREEALRWLEPVFSRSTTEIQVRRVLVDGDFATVQIVGRMGPDDPGSAIINIFRLENGLIVEHWDVTQAIPERTASGRSLG